MACAVEMNFVDVVRSVSEDDTQYTNAGTPYEK
jgi:hypothetical protein